MKKINYLLPLLMVPFVFSCANNQGGGGDDPEPEIVTEVDEAEFNKAVSLEGVEFLQVQQNMGNLEKRFEFSPTVYYWSQFKSTFSNEADGEIMVRKNDDNTYTKISKPKGVEDWGNETTVEESDFGTIPNNEDIVPTCFLLKAFTFELSYNKLSFSDERYHCKISDGQADLFLYFVNKKCVKLEIGSGDLVEAEMSYAYENKTPVWPK